jgi:hypothetical protein
MSDNQSEWQIVNFGGGQLLPNLQGTTEGTNYYLDPESGNLYQYDKSFTQASGIGPVATKEALGLSGVVSTQVPNMVDMGGESGSNMQPNGTYTTKYSLISDPAQIQADYNLQQSNPSAFNSTVAQRLADTYFDSWLKNGNVFGGDNRDWAQNSLEQIKETDPAAYYNAMLTEKAKEIGWDAGQNKINQDNIAQFQDLAQQGVAAGLSPSDVNNIFQDNYASTAQWNATNIAQRQGQGATLQGIEKILPAMAAMATAGFLAPEAAALEAGSVAEGGAFAPVDGASFAIDPSASYSLATPSMQAAPALETTTNILNSTGFTPVDGASFAIDPNATYGLASSATQVPTNNMPIGDQPGDYPMPGENGTAPEWKPSNIDPNDVTKLLDYNASLSTSPSVSDALKTANQVRQGLSTANSLSKLLTSGAGQKLTGAAQNLAAGQTSQGMAIPALLRGNQNPFLQTQQQPIRSQSDLASLASLLKQG